MIKVYRAVIKVYNNNYKDNFEDDLADCGIRL